MSPSESLVLILVILCISSIAYAFFYSKNAREANPYLDKHLLDRGMDKPPIWLYYDTSDVNSRQWMDFGARSSRALNLPFLNLCYESIVKQNNQHYRIEVIGGLTGVAELLGGWDQLPPGLRDPISPVNEAELDYIRASILAKYGGLWLTPYCICLKGFGPLPKDRTVFFGTDLDETYAGSAGTTVPGFRAIWCPQANHPMFKEWAMVTWQRVAQKRGGQQIRHDANGILYVSVPNMLKLVLWSTLLQKECVRKMASVSRLRICLLQEQMAIYHLTSAPLPCTSHSPGQN